MPAVEAYEERMARDSWWALSQASRFLIGSDAIRDRISEVARRLDGLNIPYAVAGEWALFIHGMRKNTADLQVLVTAEGLRAVQRCCGDLLQGEEGIGVRFLVTGEFAGGGKPTPVRYPHPAEAAFEKDGIKYLKLPVLIGLFLASGMSNPARLKDIADVVELIKAARPAREFANQLPECVRVKFLELWDIVQQAGGAE